MIVRYVALQPFRDRLGHRTLFAEGIDSIARLKYGNNWQAPISIYNPVILPSDKSNARQLDLYYAADLIGFFRPDIEISQKQIEFNDSCPSYYDQIDLDIEPELWNFAFIKSKEMLERQLESIGNVKSLLEDFSISACKGEVVCYARHRVYMTEEVIDQRAWNVGADVLWSRYTSGSMHPFKPRVMTDNGNLIIYMDSKYLNFNELRNENKKAERLREVQDNLIIAAGISTNLAPHKGLNNLIIDVASYVGITKGEAEKIVKSTQGHSWGGSGKPKKGDIFLAKDVRVTPPYAK